MRGRSNVAKAPEKQGFFVTREKCLDEKSVHGAAFIAPREADRFFSIK